MQPSECLPIAQRPQRKRLILLVLCLFSFYPPPRAVSSQILWSTGVPRVAFTDNNGTPSYLAYISGYVDESTPKRMAAIPFSLEQNAVISEIHADYTNNFGGVHTNPQDVSFIVWYRDGLAAPNTVAFEGSFGAYQPGENSPFLDLHIVDNPVDDDVVHRHTVDFELAAGDYYFTLYSTDTQVFWITGGAQADVDLEQDFMWRSVDFPNPGFEQFQFDSVPDLLEDPRDIYNPIFALVGEFVPEPRTNVLLFPLLGVIQMLRRSARYSRRVD